jgi:hypothetical protein
MKKAASVDPSPGSTTAMTIENTKLAGILKRVCTP